MEPKKEITAAASPRRVILESPFAGDETVNRGYLKACLRDSLSRGEAPFASHAVYPGPLNDSVPSEREAGMAAGRAWYPAARAVVFYTDLGISPGMIAGMDYAQERRIRLEFRSLPDWKAWQDDREKRGNEVGFASAVSRLASLLDENGSQCPELDTLVNPFEGAARYPGGRHW